MRMVLRLLVALVIAAALIAVPLVIVQRVECPRGDGTEDEWAVALPGQQPFRSSCREPESGGELLLEFVRGL